MEEEIIIPCSPTQKTELKKYLEQLEFTSSIPDLYWLPVPEEMLSKLQMEHLDSCGPYALALDTEGEEMVLETLVRRKISFIANVSPLPPKGWCSICLIICV